MTVPDGLERLLKGLEGHVVDSVDIEREDGFLHVKLSVIQLDPKYALHETLGGPKPVSFSVMWKKTLDNIFESYNKQLDEILSNLGEFNSDLEDAVVDLRKVNA